LQTDKYSTKTTIKCIIYEQSYAAHDSQINYTFWQPRP